MFKRFFRVNAEELSTIANLSDSITTMGQLINSEIPRTTYLGSDNDARYAIKVLSDPRCSNLKDYSQGTFDSSFPIIYGLGCGMLFWVNEAPVLDPETSKFLLKNYRNLFVDNGVLCGISIALLPAIEKTNKHQIVFALTKGVNRPYAEQETYLYIHTNHEKEIIGAQKINLLPSTISIPTEKAKETLNDMITNEMVRRMIENIFKDGDLNGDYIKELIDEDDKNESLYLRSFIPESLESISQIKHNGKLQYIDMLLQPPKSAEEFKQRHIKAFDEFKQKAKLTFAIENYVEDYQWLFYRLAEDFKVPFNQLETYANRTDLLMLFAYCSDIKSIDLTKDQMTTLTMLYDKYYNQIINQELVNDITGVISQLLTPDGASLNIERTLKQIHIKYFLYRHRIEPSDKFYQIINNSSIFSYNHDYQWLFYRLVEDFNVPSDQLESYANRTDLLMLFAYCSDIKSIDLSEKQQTTLTKLYDAYYHKILSPVLVDDLKNIINDIITSKEVSRQSTKKIKQMDNKYFFYLRQLNTSTIINELLCDFDYVETLHQILKNDKDSDKLLKIINQIDIHQQQLMLYLKDKPEKKHAIESAFNQSVMKLMQTSIKLIEKQDKLSRNTVAKKINQSLYAIKEKAAEERHPWLVRSTQVLANALIFTLTFGLAQEAHAQLTGKYWFFSDHKTKSSEIVDGICRQLTSTIACA